MRLFIRFCVALFSLGLITLVAGGAWIMHEVKKPGDFAEAKEILIAPGSSGRDVAQQLQTENIIDQPLVFYGLLRSQNIVLKAGEYAMPAHASMHDIVRVLKSGNTIQRQVTLPEGLTVKQALKLIQESQYLTGDVPEKLSEGTLLPETYSFTRGETRQNLIKRMEESQKKLLAELWEKRDTSLPLKSPEEAVILASIVEKETGKPEERSRIAGVFYNRLTVGMPLQADPTIIYAITDGLGSMEGKPLYAKSLEIDSPYNSYKNVGLTPGPIANPGRAALEAVLHPEKNDYIFFVADGTGGHIFSATLAEHNKNVANWREIKKNLTDKTQ